MEEQQHSQGGHIPGEPVPVMIHPEECLIAKRGGSFVCVREGAHRVNHCPEWKT